MQHIKQMCKCRKKCSRTFHWTLYSRTHFSNAIRLKASNTCNVQVLDELSLRISDSQASQDQSTTPQQMEATQKQEAGKKRGDESFAMGTSACNTRSIIFSVKHRTH
uniref:Uncharacterized protein n=1 Tax=Guillardia theta TaxID=55529 RepID=A0A7S4KRW4_GUITH|mmetsp:Transcript_29899/g.95794  ORF Transcript_29899/g.95794 Transcript_29899/m.95794 type:complete len:107 (+) Transcript_29899:95-415(+)